MTTLRKGHPVSDGLALEETGNATETDQADDIASLDDGMLLDYITGEPVKDTPKEQVRQRIARALLHEYGISVEEMVPDCRVRVEGKLKKVDIAIFAPGTGPDRKITDLRRVVMCEKEPKIGTKGAFHMRDHKQAEKDFGPLFDVLREAAECRYGLWTNGLEFFFFEKEITRFDVKFQPRGDWPLGDDTVGSRTVASNAYLRPADREMLLTAFGCESWLRRYPPWMRPRSSAGPATERSPGKAWRPGGFSARTTSRTASRNPRSLRLR